MRLKNKKLSKIGTAYCFFVPKALVEAEVMSQEKRYIVEISEE